jgi:hypothetical protein
VARTVARDGAETPVLSEKAWQAMVVQLAALTGWRTFHPYDSRRSAAGWLDLVLVRGPDLVFAELKTDRGRVTSAQAEWIDALRAAGQEVVVWRPADWPTVEQRLRRPRPGRGTPRNG